LTAAVQKDVNGLKRLLSAKQEAEAVAADRALAASHIN
jgi:hypothetical protein